LSRALKWGQGYIGDVDIEDILNEVDRSKPVKLDRWQINIEKLNQKPSRKSNDSITAKFMNNYLSIGCDALVTLNFHRERTNSSFSSRLFNKLIYFKYGTIDTFVKECRTLTENIELELDDKKVELPHLESIVVLNIPFWGGGVQPWTQGQTSAKTRKDIPEPSFNDDQLEVFGIYSSFHIAQLQVGLAEPYRIGQARSVQIKLRKTFPIQIDGEPWEQNSACITISKFNQATMLEKVD
jgi:diacylglycerol kinase (ATP)